MTSLNRPYAKLTARELEALAKRHWESRADLEALAAELKHRTSAPSQALAQRVLARLGADWTGNRAHHGSDRSRERAGQSSPGGGSDNRDLASEVRRLERLLSESQASEVRLRKELEKFRAQKQLSDLNRVHLTDTAPRWLVEAARTAFRKQYHPDKHQSVEAKQRAHHVFVEGEKIFEKLLSE